MDINVKNIEYFWQKVWQDEKLFVPDENNNTPKYFNFDSAPFPNGNLHLGHVRNYVLGDILARYKRLNGYNVLYTTNFDSFGLPNQLEAEKQSKTPEQYTKECISHITDDLKHLGISYDWSRVNSTSDPGYFKWTQWLFLELHSAGLIYRKNASVNWCETCNSVLANMELQAGRCNRCNSVIEIKNMQQWYIALSKYSPELYDSIEDLSGWSDRAKKLIKGFIGKTSGTLVSFLIQGENKSVKAFLPEKYKLHDVTFVASTMTEADANLQTQALKSVPASKRRRNNPLSENRSGFDSGIKLIHPELGVPIPLFYVNYLSDELGPPVKAGVPASDQADKRFSEKYKIPEVKSSIYVSNVKKISVEGMVYYHVHDWVVSRQKKWGTPMPMLECPACGFVPVKKENLPFNHQLNIPGKIEDDCNCPICSKCAKPVADTLDCYIDDIWCFLSAELNSKKYFSIEKMYESEWFPASHYHAGYDIYMYLHLYRFITRFLYKRGYVNTQEPVTEYFGHDMVLQNGKKMSKRHKNSKNMRLLIDEHGADVIRVAMILLANPAKPVQWDNELLKRSKKIILKVINLASLLINTKIINSLTGNSRLDAGIKKKLEKISNQLNKDVANYIESYRPGSAIQLLEKHTKEVYKIINALSICAISSETHIYLKKYVLKLCILYSPFAPHISEEIWQRLGGEKRIVQAKWPVPSAC